MTKAAGAPVGLIEGFFGRPWSGAVRKAYAEFLSSHGFDHYIYAPKADRYLRRGWRESFPPAALQQLAQLSETYRARRIRFGVGLTPFEIYLRYDAEAKAALRAKVQQLNEIGVDILCVLFDDMRGDTPRLAECQARIVSDISAWSHAQSCIVCPTYYSDDPILERVFGVAPPRYLESLGQALDPAVDVFWTGEEVCSRSYSSRHLGEVAERIGRKPFVWDNHLANDGRARCSHLYLNFWSQAWSIDAGSAAGIAINPMCQPQLSRIPLAVFGGITSRDRDEFAQKVYSLCGSTLGKAIVEDSDFFQYQGLTKTDAPLRAQLIKKYADLEPDPYASEVGAWLRGEYEFDPNCLTD
jgi:hyaluronoglucosaminidase